MTPRRLRDTPNDAELRRLYATPHDHTCWEDHKLRVNLTVQVGRWLGPYTSVADLSCGNAAIARQVAYGQGTQPASLHLGDYAAGYEHTGPIERTLDDIPNVDLFICSETIEHLADPWTIIGRIRSRAETLLLSTPIDEGPNDGNPEHVWSWGVEDVHRMLRDAGWRDVVHVDLRLPNYLYDFQIWGCR